VVQRSRPVWAPLLLVTLLAVPALLPLCLAEPEPNDTFAQAIPVDSDAASFTGTLSQTDTVDLYKMMLNRTATTVEAVTAELTKTSTGGQVRLYIYDEDGYRLASNATVSAEPVSSSVCAPYTGYVFIGVIGWVGASGYDYRLNLTKSNLTPVAGLLDQNNRQNEAVAVQDGYSVTKGLDSVYNTGDFFLVQLGSGPALRDVLTVTVTVPASADLIVELFKAGNSTYIALSETGDIFNPDPGVNETLYFVAEEAGPYAIRVWAEHGGGQYSIKVRVFRAGPDTNNDLENATAVLLDGSFVDNISQNYDPDDYYRIFLRSDTTIDITLTTAGYDPASRLPNLNLYLMDPSRSYVNSSTGSDPVERVSHLVTLPGDYFIRVGAGRNSAGGYTLDIVTVQPPIVLVSEVDIAVDEDNSTSVDLSSVFQDQKGRPLAFNFTAAEHVNCTLSSGGQPPKMFLGLSPDPDWNGHAVLEVSASNLDGKLSRAVVNLTVRPVNDPPAAEHSELSFSGAADIAFTLPVSVYSLFSDIDGDVLDYTVRDPDLLAVSFGPDGTVTATPPQYWSGTRTFHIVASDPAGATAEVAVTLTIMPVNHAPLVLADVPNITFAEHQNATVDLTRAFWDPDNDTLAFSALDNIMLGVTFQNGRALVGSRDPHWFGNESITFVAADPSNATAMLVINFTVNWVNDPPYVFRMLQNQSIREDAPTTLFNLNGYFRDPHGEPLAFTVTGFSANVTVNISSDGWVTFTPAANWSGSSGMHFFAADPFGERASMQFNLTVEPGDDAPVLSGARISPSKGDTGTVFTFTVVVLDQDSASVTVMLKAGRKSIIMEKVSGTLSSGATYRVRTALPEGDNAFYFQADDGERTASTDSVELKVSASTPDNTILYISLLALIIIVVALALAFSPSSQKKGWNDEEE